MWMRLWRKLGRLGAPRKTKPYHLIAEGSEPGVTAREVREAGRAYKEYVVDLPDGYPARRVTVRLSVPPMPRGNEFAFTEHVCDEAGETTRTVIATATGGFAISPDLGASWCMIHVPAYRRRRFLHVKAIGDGEYLVQVEPVRPNRDQPHVADVVVVHESGAVVATTPSLSVPWHGCRAVDVRGGVIMYAEYPPNPGRAGRLVSRVFRSRDRGRTWEVVFERSGEQVRHFHFLQARPGAREWWLTSGDAPNESRVWVTRNDGDAWIDISGPGQKTFTSAGVTFPRDLYRLTDLAWDGDDVIWGTDDVLWGLDGGQPGARLFRSRIGETLSPVEVARCKWHLRSLVDLGHSWILTSQGCPQPQTVSQRDARPGVYLMPKSVPDGMPGAVHLFDADTYSGDRTSFSSARASRTSVDGTFFTYRGRNDVFRGGQLMLRWDVRFD